MSENAIEKGQLYERDGARRIVIISGGTDDDPRWSALDVEDGNVDLGEIEFLTMGELKQRLAGWELVSE